MNQLHRAGRTQSRLGIAASSLAGSHHQQRAQALAAVEYGVAHGLAQSGRHEAVLRIGHPLRQRLLDGVKLLGAPGAQVKQGELFRGIQIVDLFVELWRPVAAAPWQ